MDTSDNITKQCTRCGETKIIQEFHRMAKSPDGYRTICKKCRAIAEGKVYIPYQPPGFKYCRNCKQMLPRTTEYFQASKLGRFGLDTRCRKCKNAEGRDYHDANRERVLTRKHEYYIDNLEREQKRAKKYRDEHPTYIHDWYIASKPRLLPLRRVYASDRRAREMNAEGTYTPQDIEQMYEDQCGYCAYCGIRLFDTYHLEHIIPLSRGGSNWPENLCLTCRDCNLSKNDKLTAEWEAVRGW